MNKSFSGTKIAAVVVTYNRLSLVQECIYSLQNQIKQLDEIFIINNNSNDGTLEWLSTQNNLTVITQENLGSAGGQYTGVKVAFEKGYNWIWCMDDDTIPDANALVNLMEFVNRNNKIPIGFLSSKILWTNGEIHKMNMPGYFHNKNVWNQIPETKIQTGEHKIDVCSFVCCLFNSEAIAVIGYPDKRYFIWYDDLEYTSRFKKYNNYYISNSIAIHKTPNNESIDLMHLNKLIDIKMRYGLRNFVFFYKKYNIVYLIEMIVKFIVINVIRLFFGKTSIKATVIAYGNIFNGLIGRFTPLSGKK